MPGFIGVTDFVNETKEDHNNPTISSFADKIPQLRRTVNILEEVNLLCICSKKIFFKNHILFADYRS